jgi:xylulokinase
VHPPLLLGLDLGTSSAKALLLDAGGAVVGEGGAGYAVVSARPGWAETDPAEWWRAAALAVRRAVGSRSAGVAAVGLSGQMHGLVLADADARPLRPAALWPDVRAEAEAEEWRRLPETLLDALANPVVPGMAGPLLHWLARHERSALAAARWALPPKDWLRLRLTGVAASEPSDASATLLYDLGADGWAGELVAALGLPARLLPPIVASAGAAGRLTAEAAAHLGLPAVPVAAGAADTAAAALGTGLLDPGPLQLTVGTGAQLVVPLDRPAADPRRVTHLYRAAAPDRWYAMAAVQNAGLAMEWVLRTLGATWDEAHVALESTGPGAAGVTFLPHLTGERTPFLDPHLTGAWRGLRLHHGRPHLLRAALEGVAFSIRLAAEALAGAGHDTSAPRLAGGGSRHPAWRQLLADVLGRPLAAVPTPDASARGAALLAGVAAGVFANARATVSLAEPPAPAAAPRRPEAYEEPYRRFLHAAPPPRL